MTRHTRGRRLASLVLIATALATGLAGAQPVSPGDRIPVDVRRTTLVVRDIDHELSFWRDALGLQVVYDRVLEQPLDGADPKGPKRKLRLVLLRANDDFVGQVGLMQYISPKRPARPPGEDRPVVGDVILVLNAADLDTRWDMVKSVAGVTVLSAPSMVEYPAPGGGTIPVMVSMLRDPEGYFVELDQIMDKTADGAD